MRRIEQVIGLRGYQDAGHLENGRAGFSRPPVADVSHKGRGGSPVQPDGRTDDSARSTSTGSNATGMTTNGKVTGGTRCTRVSSAARA